MPNSPVHLRQAIHNNNFANENIFDKPDYDDWRITIMFYEALQLVEAYFSNSEQHYETHRKRKEGIIRDPVLFTNIAAEYDLLSSLSRKMRYDCMETQLSDLIKAQKSLNVIRKFFNR